MRDHNYKTQKKRFRYYIIAFWSIIIAIIVSFSIFILRVAEGHYGDLPGFKDLENPKTFLASEVYSCDNVLLGKYYFENRSNASYKELSSNLLNALIATEDIRFYKHSGIDVRGLFRVFFRTIILRQDAGGGSTLTQQLSKKLFHIRPKSKWKIILQKIKEWIIAVKLEKSYTKEEIITMYLNTVDFSGKSYGIKAAAKEFFNKPTDSLKIEEAAVLVGLLQATTRFNPIINPANAFNRRNIVIGQLEKYHFITKQTADSIKKLPIDLEYRLASHNTGLARYFREHIRLELQQWSKNHLKPNAEPYNIYKDGLKIYTTIHSKMQKYAEEAVQEHLSLLQDEFFEHWKGSNIWRNDTLGIINRAIKNSERYKFLKSKEISKDSILKIFNIPVSMQVFTWKGDRDTIMSPLDSIKYYKQIVQAGFMVMDPNTGYIKAWVGGPDFRYFKYDHVNIKAKRQVGSTFKPFVYTIAIDNGWPPCKTFPDQPVTFEEFDDWTPKNSSGEYSGEMYTLKRGLQNSKNSVTAHIMKEFGPEPVVDLVKRLGISSEVLPVPSICLGTPDISVFELVGAYSVFANKGLKTKPIYFTRIEDKNGNIIDEFNMERKEAMSERTAYLMVKLLQNVVEHGTGARLRYKFELPKEIEIGGKTGTTQNHSDGWFIGFTPELVAGTWVGWNDRTVHFRNIRLGQGAHMALPIWALLMQKVLADETLGYSTEAMFEKPSASFNVEFDCGKIQKERKPKINFNQ